MVMIVGSVIRLEGSLCGHRHASSFEDHLGSAVGPDIDVVDFSAYVEMEYFGMPLTVIPVRVGHCHFAHARVLRAKPPAVILMRLYYDNIFSFLVLHLDICNPPV